LIGGRVLDTSTLLAFARETSTYAQAFVWTAVAESIVLLIPATAVAEAWSALNDPQRAVLDVLLGLHVTVLDPLDGQRAREIGQLGGPSSVVHTVACARERGWAVLTAEAERYRGYNVHIEALP
jgi:hypothetical protein